VCLDSIAGALKFITSPLQDELLGQFGRLSDDRQKLVVEFAKSLQAPRKLPPGAMASDLKEVFGVISSDDARQMRQAIAEGCEQISDD
jgi:hypothetical protein